MGTRFRILRRGRRSTRGPRRYEITLRVYDVTVQRRVFQNDIGDPVKSKRYAHRPHDFGTF